ncbi:uncharacterized protein TNCV_1216351 [Trichonephila clavipes]|nr:uncharacterized protein TNCV_1216351 [Trichonephila clavipes]
MIRWALKLSEFNIEWEHRPGVQNVVVDVLSWNPVGNMDGSQISCAALRALALNSREQLIRDQVETLYEGRRSSNGSDRSHPGKSKKSRKTSSEESKGRKSNKGNTGLEDPRLKRKGSKHGDQKRPTTEPTQGIKRTVPSSISSRNHKYRRPNNPSQGPQSIAGPSHQIDTRQCKPPTEGSRQGASVQYDRPRETRTTLSEGNSAAEGRPVRSRQVTAVKPCPYYLRSRLNRRNTRGAKEHWDRQSTAEQPQEKEPQHGSLRRRSGG